MKFKTSALAMTATVAVGLMSSAFAAETSYDKLGFTTNNTFSANASGTSNGSWNATPVVTESKIEIDSDADAPLRFTPATANAVNDATELKFNVEASVVPNSVGLATSDDAQCGFAIKDTDGTTNFWVYTSTGWTSVPGTVPAAGSMFDLTVKIDYRTGFAQAKYLVGTTDLGWYALHEPTEGSATKGVSNIDFIGNGKLASLRGDVLQIVSEVIPINPTGGSGNVEVKFTEQQLAALKEAVGGNKDIAAVVDALNNQAPQTNGNKAFDNYILFNKVTGATAADVPVVKADPAATPAGNKNNVVVKVPTLAIQIVEGVTVTHKLMGSATGEKNDSWTQVGETKTGANPQFEIPYNSTYRYFKVETAVSTTGVAN